MSDKVLKEAYEKIKFIEEGSDDSIHDETIDFLDDMLATEEDPEAADLLRYAISHLQAAMTPPGRQTRQQNTKKRATDDEYKHHWQSDYKK